MNDKTLFWSDPLRGIEKTFGDLLHDLSQVRAVSPVLRPASPYEGYVSLLAALCNAHSILLEEPSPADSTASASASLTLLTPVHPTDFEGLLALVREGSWHLTLSSSGTSGNPKKATHTRGTLLKSLRSEARHREDVWALCYNPFHIAGLSVFFQALFNHNGLVFLFESAPDRIAALLETRKVTRLSATPSFYRRALPEIVRPLPAVKSITFGGELLTEDTLREARAAFPNAKVHNVFASTEIGSLLVSHGVGFSIPTPLHHLVRLAPDGELEVHSSLVRQESLGVNSWYRTGDMTEPDGPGSFRIVGRRSDRINIGGYLVNPSEVEAVMRTLPEISDVAVLARKSSVTANILTASVVLKGDLPHAEAEAAIQQALEKALPRWMVPRVIRFVPSLELGKTGKRARA